MKGRWSMDGISEKSQVNGWRSLEMNQCRLTPEVPEPNREKGKRRCA